MTPLHRAQALGAGVIAGLAGGLFGVGGGIMLVPLLRMWFGATQHQAHGTSLAVIGMTAIASTIVYGMHGNVAWRTALVVALASIVTARYGARLASKTSSRALTRAFAVFLAVIGLRLLFGTPHATGVHVPAGVASVAFELVLGGAVGLLSGYMGVGGGALSVPAFTLLLGMSQQLAQGTSLAVILAAGPAGAIEHARRGNVIGRLVPWLGIGAALGAPLASWAVQGLPQALLTRAFAVFLLVNSVIAWTRADAKKAAPPPR